MKNSQKKTQRERKIEPTDTFTERIAEGVAITTSPTGLIIVDFLKPVLYLVAKGDKIQGLRGELRPDVRIYLTLNAAESLQKSLSEHLEKYKRKYIAEKGDEKCKK